LLLLRISLYAIAGPTTNFLPFGLYVSTGKLACAKMF
jgi:hypothetical protein